MEYTTDELLHFVGLISQFVTQQFILLFFFLEFFERNLNKKVNSTNTFERYWHTSNIIEVKNFKDSFVQ